MYNQKRAWRWVLLFFGVLVMAIAMGAMQIALRIPDGPGMVLGLIFGIGSSIFLMDWLDLL